MGAPRLAYMLRVYPKTGMPYDLPFSDRTVADEAARRLVAANGGHASLTSVQHLQDYWNRTAVPSDKDLVA